MRSRLSITWTISILAAALLPLAVAGFATLSILERTTLDGAALAREQLADAAVAVVTNHLEGGREKLAAMAALLERDAGSPGATAASDATARELDRMLAPRGAFLELGVRGLAVPDELLAQSQSKVFNATQNRYYDENVPPENVRFVPGLQQWVESIPSDDARLASARSGRSYMAERAERSGSVATLSLSSPAPGGRVLLAKLDLAPVQSLLASLSPGGERALELLDGTGEALFAAGTPVRGDDGLTTERDVGHGGWRVRVSESRSTALVPLAAARARMLVGFGVACALLVLLSLFFARLVVAPVRALASTAERFGKGELALRTGIERGDEIGQLAAAFDRMASSLSELDRLKSEFVAHVSHELRTPLTSAKLTLANVEDGLAGPEALARVRADLDRLVRLVDELLDLARIEAGIELARETVRLEDVVRDAVDVLRPLARVPIDVSGRSEELHLDRARVHEVLVNLLDNALKHARNRVAVEIGARELRVVDDGPGVPEAERERVFERFVRLRATESSRGTGLGLSIARKLVELHGGTLRCEGSTFTARF